MLPTPTPHRGESSALESVSSSYAYRVMRTLPMHSHNMTFQVSLFITGDEDQHTFLQLLLGFRSTV